MLRPVALPDEQDASCDDEQGTDDEPGLQRLVEEDERDHDREERRGSDNDRGPRWSRVTNREA